MRWLAVALGVVAGIRLAHADDAAALFARGRTFAEAGNYAAACTMFAESYALDHAVGTELNLADCNEHLGHLREAAQWFERSATKLEGLGDKRAQFARARHDALFAKLGTIVVRVPEPKPAGLEITIAGRNASTAQDRVDPGDVDVRVTAPGRPDFATTAHVASGATVVVDVPGPELPHAAAPTTTVRRRSRVYLALGAGALGAATGLVSLGFGLAARSDYNAELDNHDCTHQNGKLVCNTAGASATRHAGTLADVSTGLGIGAVVLGAAAAILYVTAPRDTVTIEPVASPTALGVAIRGAF